MDEIRVNFISVSHPHFLSFLRRTRIRSVRIFTFGRVATGTAWETGRRAFCRLRGGVTHLRLVRPSQAYNPGLCSRFTEPGNRRHPDFAASRAPPGEVHPMYSRRDSVHFCLVFSRQPVSFMTGGTRWPSASETSPALQGLADGAQVTGRLLPWARFNRCAAASP